MLSIHRSVLLKEVLEYLNPKSGENFIDCTFGGGGHSLEILKRIQPNGKLLGIDANQDIEKEIKKLSSFAKATADRKIKWFKNFIFVNDNFKNLKNIVKNNFKKDLKVAGILLDLGLSSDELEKSGRGFSFQKDEPLDMRFDVRQEKTASNILNFYSIKKLYDVFKTFGNCSCASQLSKNIFQQRRLKKIETTQDLVKLILQIDSHKGKLHPATKIFQALRIEVNDELDNLVKVLSQAIEILQPGGRLVVISFHSLEDRIVKNFFRELGKCENKILNILTKKPVAPSFEEIKNNPRSRSAKMRAIEKI